MKNSTPTITLLGSNSGNNVGDAAILSGILEILSQKLPGAKFLVPSTKPEFVEKHYGDRYNVSGVNIMPWTGSLRFLGIPVLRCLAQSDAALICDGIIFGKKLYNPGFNMLITLAPLVPFAKMLNCKLVCYSCGIGPFPNGQGAKLARFLINNCDLVMLREEDSIKLAKEIGVTKPIELTGDAAFINEVSLDSRAEKILQDLKVPGDKPLLGINVTSYLDSWVEPGNRLSDRTSFIETLAGAVISAQQNLKESFRPLVFSTHPMDEVGAAELARRLNTGLVSNTQMLSHDMQAIMRRCELFLGMRFHSAVLASAVYTPIITLNYAPKVRGYMRLLGCERYGLEMGNINHERLTRMLTDAWQERRNIGTLQRPMVERLQGLARHAADVLVERIYSNLTESAQLATAPSRSASG